MSFLLGVLSADRSILCTLHTVLCFHYTFSHSFLVVACVARESEEEKLRTVRGNQNSRVVWVIFCLKLLDLDDWADAAVAALIILKLNLIVKPLACDSTDAIPCRLQ